MEKASEAILSLKPVTFHYKTDNQRHTAIWFDCRRSRKGKSSTGAARQGRKTLHVRYDAVNAMLLNEFLKEHRKVEETGDDQSPVKVNGGPAAERLPSDGCTAHCTSRRASVSNPKGERTARSEQTDAANSQQ